ncbi:MAG TPA: cob(I)yrinic acid a,c-diamide adenosyltransferase [Clostridiales bacterium]|nr:cob(I)yrinic acid a,c-diamide adenosyltransferase [Clostridiales bacterium]
MRKGLVHLYCGEGKGKTTAAMGLCLRAAGRGLRVGIAQFIKPGDSGEIKILSTLENVKVFPFLPDVKFTNIMSEAERSHARNFYSGLIKLIYEEIDNFNLLILDEAVAAVTENLVELESIIHLIKNRPSGLEIVITGRKPPQELMDIADYISEIRNIRHPFDKGIPARKGIEW